MIVRYYVQFTAGLGDLAHSSLDEDLGGIHVVYRDDSSLLFDVNRRAEVILGLAYVKNVFIILGEVPRAQDFANSVDLLIRRLKDMSIERQATSKEPFRVMASINGELIGLPGKSKSRIEDFITARTGAKAEPRGSGAEYWLLGRRDFDKLLFGLKLTKAKAKAKRAAVPKGMLAPELSELLVRSVKPSEGSVFLDPFAGRGAIVQSRIRFPAKKIVYSDINYQSCRSDFGKELLRSRLVTFLSEDALELPSIAAHSVDEIVTDPPWGEYEELAEPYIEFSRKMMKSFKRVLAPDGRCLVLVNRRQEDDLADAFSSASMRILAQHRILVNGHPATALMGRN